MTQYLAIDFGTTNCLASFANREGKLEFVELDDRGEMLPSAIFVYSEDLESSGFSEDVFDARCKREYKLLLEKFEAERQRIEAQLKSFSDAMRPRVIKPRGYERASHGTCLLVSERYRTECEQLPRRIHQFESTILKEERDRLVRSLKEPPSEDQFRGDFRTRFYIEMLQNRYSELKEFTLFSALANRRFSVAFGGNAIRKYTNDPCCGFFMRSPKAFLGSNLSSSHTSVFVQIVSAILREIKRRAEESSGLLFDGVVLGRPVNYIGSQSELGNERAINIMREAGKRAGFSEVRFVMEPLAASLAISNQIFDKDAPVLVIDAGGGTTDIAYLAVSQEQEEKLSVCAVTGDRVGGNDFDETIAFDMFPDLIGSRTILSDGKPMPIDLIASCLNTRDINAQIKFRQAGDQILRYAEAAPGSAALRRLLICHRLQLQHQMILFSEKCKISLANLPSVSEDFYIGEERFGLELSRADLGISCSQHLSKIRSLIELCISQSPNKSAPVRAFLTGGMSHLPHLVAAVRETIPKGSSLHRLAGFKSIAAGLGMVARQLSLSYSPLDEPDIVRGVPVLH